MRDSKSGYAMAVALVLAAAGCGYSRDYIYRPTEQATATTAGYPTARYPIPPERPQGDVKLTSFGINELEVTRGDDGVPFLLVRMAVSNDSGTQPWSLDTREQIVSIPGVGQSRPTYVNTDSKTPPFVEVLAGTSRVLDFYYPLPPGRNRAGEIPAFEVLWRVRTGDRLVAERTPFERREIRPPPPAYAYGSAYGSAYDSPFIYHGVAWGPVWWYDPFYPSFTFHSSFALHRRYPFLRTHPHHQPFRVITPARVRSARVAKPR